MRIHEIQAELLSIIPRLAGHRILIVGDLFLDEYILGEATRLSREAPIPVLELRDRFFLPGGAANPAHNIRALGAEVAVVGVIGNDEAGRQLLRELERASIDPSGIVVDRSRPTTTKTRVMAEGSLRHPQQLARIDHIDRRPLDSDIEAAAIAQIQALLPHADALLISDYQTAVACPRLVSAAQETARRLNRLRTVDAQGSFGKYAGFNLIKGNRSEVERALGHPLLEEEDYQKAGEHFLDELRAEAVLITRGPDGLSVVSHERGHVHLPAANRTEVFDVTGAGDTVIAVATLALVAGADVLSAARLANCAAGWVVRKVGNAVATAEDLVAAVTSWEEGG